MLDRPSIADHGIRCRRVTELPSAFFVISRSSSAMLLLATHSRYPDSVSTIDESVLAACHFGNTQSAYLFGSFLVFAAILGLLLSRSAGETHPATNAKPNAPIRIRISSLPRKRSMYHLASWWRSTRRVRSNHGPPKTMISDGLPYRWCSRNGPEPKTSVCSPGSAGALPR